MHPYVPLPLEDETNEGLFNPENILAEYYSSQAFVESQEANDPDIFFERGQWFLRTDTGDIERTYEVVLCGSEDGSRTYLDFELISDQEY